jgi:alcohol dehydrogenase class IV
MVLALSHLPRVVENGNDLASRQAMQEAAFLAGVAIDNCGTGAAHSIGHALGSLYHLPHGMSVAVGLRAALEWNTAGEPDAYVDAATALDCRVDEIAAKFVTLCLSSGMASAMSGLDAVMSVDDITTTMFAVENQPMLDNNARAVAEADRHLLAERTVDEWNRLRS